MTWRATDEERQRIIACYGRTNSLKAVAAETGRSTVMVKNVLAESGERADAEEMPRIWWLENNERFHSAMMSAVAAGLEKPPATHVIVDATPPPPGARLYPFVPPPRSHTGSPSEWCADHAQDRR